MSKGELKVYSTDEVAKHNKEGDLWIIIDGEVYDLSKFADMHPGGLAVLIDPKIAGKDATTTFFGLHRGAVLKKYKRLRIGTVQGQKPQVIYPEPGQLSPVPYAEPTWLRRDQGFVSPYFDESHYALQKEVRRFFDTYVKEEAYDKEVSGKWIDKEVYELMGKPEWEINAMRMGPGKHLWGRTLPGGVDPKKFNYFHELVVVQELVRIGAPGSTAGLQSGMVIGLPPVLNFGSDELKAEVLPDILRGKKYICLAISEAAAGSDVQGMQTRAELTPDGQHYIVNGTKKWITNGVWSDWFMTGVKTGDKLSMLLIPRVEGVETKTIKTSYSTSAGTSFVTFDNVKVPAKYLIGGEGNGVKVILSNFNHERWVINCRVIRYSRFIVEECFKWANQRYVFGKPLIQQPVIRQKFARMFADVEAGQTWLENITHQMCNMSYAEQSKHLAGPMALLKYFLTRTAANISDEAVQILGGRGLTVGGLGQYIEQFNRTQKFDAVLGGSEEILADLGVRQALKYMPKAVL